MRSLRFPEVTPALLLQPGALTNSNFEGANLPPLLAKGANYMKRIKSFLNDESGMETLEYALIAGLIAAAAIIVYSTGWATTLAARLTSATNAS